jgi:LysM repeat protein
MKKKAFIILVLLACLIPAGSFGQLIACRDSIKDGYNFWLYLPDDYNDTVPEKPLVIFLHGRSLCGRNLANVRRYGCIDAIERGRKIDAVIVAPQTQNTWKPDKVHEVYHWVKTHCAIDTTRVYVLGMSLGGYGTINYTASYPETVAAAMALCGGASIKGLCGLNEVPLWIVHGTADRDVPLYCSQKVVDEMVQCGDTSLLLFDKLRGEAHSKLARIFYLEQTYDWLFSHSLSDSVRKVNKDYTISREIMNTAYNDLSKDTSLRIIDSRPTKPTYVTKTEAKYYVIKKGDTLSKIAARHHTSVNSLCRLNGMKKTDKLKIGRRIRVK